MKYWILHAILLTSILSILGYKSLINSRVERIERYEMALPAPSVESDSSIVVPLREPEVVPIIISPQPSTFDKLSDILTFLLGLGNLTVIYFQLKDRKQKND